MPLIKNETDIKNTIAVYETIRQTFLYDGFKEYRFIKSDGISDFLSLVYGIPFAAVYIVIYCFFNSFLPEFSFTVFILMAVLLFITTPLHEFLHGLGWSIFTKNGFKNIYIYLPLGISDACCHCTEPLNYKHYIIGNIMPIIVLSIIPAFISFLTEIPVIFYFSLFNAFGCGSDVSNTLLAYKNRDKLILDYPTDCGFTAYKKEP